MCGICGFTGINNIEVLKKMTEVISHRGPDSEGYYFDDGINLGVRRLKIIDLIRGDQPIFNEDKSVVMIFNGEIYNYLELREILESKGHKFYTNTDTEVIVHLYEDYKEECVLYLCGMFAFALWDKKEKKLFIARDRIGIKPLFYSIFNGDLIFGSEIKSILQYPEVSQEINLKSIDEYFTFLYIPFPNTIYKHIFQLPPASYIIYRERKFEIKKYWSLSFEKTNYREDWYIENLNSLLEEVIKQHLFSDVPIGIFLSGGLDSSTVALYASKIISDLNAFTIVYPSTYSEYNELNKAKKISKLLSINHYIYVVKPKEAFSLLPNLVLSFDQPFADSSSIVTYLISKFSSEKLKVALTGIGGDELFCGYPRYQGIKLANYFPKLKFIEKLVYHIPETYSPFNITGRVKRFIYGLDKPNLDECYLSFVSFYFNEEKEIFYKKEFLEEVRKINGTSHISYFFNYYEKEDLLNRVMFTDINSYLVDDLLCMADRMSMANSIELRIPFCDHRVIEFVAKIPTNLRMRGFSKKYLLKKILSRYIPKEIISQKKMGFMVPLGIWLKDNFKKYFEDFIKKEEYSDYLNYDFIKKMWNEHIKCKTNYSDQLFSLLVLDNWLKTFNIKLPKLKEKISFQRKKLKILIASDFIFEDEEGGSGRVISCVSDELVKKGHHVVFITQQTKKNLSCYQKVNNKEIYRYKLNLLSYFELKNIIEKILNNLGKVDLVIYNHPLSGFLIRDFIRKKIPQIYYFHSPWHIEYEIKAKNKKLLWPILKINKYLRWKVEDEVTKSCKKFLVLSEYMKELLKNFHNINDERIVLVPGGVDVEKFSPVEDKNPIRMSLNLPLDKKILFTVRNLEPRMGLENLLLSFSKICKERKDIVLIIGGKGTLEKKLKNLAFDLGIINQTLFVGFIPDEILPKYYQSADLFVLPTLNLEGFGLVTIEALSCGIPVVGTPIGGTIEILSKFNLLTESTSPKAIAKKIKEFLELDEEKIKNLSKTLREYVVENYSWEKVIGKIEDEIYKNLSNL